MGGEPPSQLRRSLAPVHPAATPSYGSRSSRGTTMCSQPVRHAAGRPASCTLQIAAASTPARRTRCGRQLTAVRALQGEELVRYKPARTSSQGSSSRSGAPT